MKKYRTNAPYTLQGEGNVELSDEQYSRRQFALGKTDKAGVYVLNQPISFKAAEEFSTDIHVGDKDARVTQLVTKRAPVKKKSAE